MTAPTKLDVDALAQEIRRVDGSNSLGTGALAEALMPFFSALPASEAGWRDIESAPKDGTRVLLWRGKRRIVVGWWCDDRYAKKPRPYWTDDQERILGVLNSRSNTPEGWMPLPSAPDRRA